LRGRPRGEARRDGWKRRQVPYSFLAGLREVEAYIKSSDARGRPDVVYLNAPD
jgi:hypothetical protein